MAPIRPQLLVSHANHSATETSICMYVCMHACVSIYLSIYLSIYIMETTNIVIGIRTTLENSIYLKYIYIYIYIFFFFFFWLSHENLEVFYFTIHSIHFIYGYIYIYIYIWHRILFWCQQSFKR